jgi:asparagine synthase (glutamine-hydrolysing)
MCGIAGIVDYEEGIEGVRPYLGGVQETLGRRGPDQRGLYHAKEASLIHTRLSVVDLENGKQPMLLEWGGQQYAIVYNGELYNTEELRNRLKAKGHLFASRSDTEVLLHCYAEWKEKCVGLLNGIYAFAVWESRAKRLFVARDRIGVKPFFYMAGKKGRFLFASEIKALLAFPGVDAVLGEGGLCELLLVGPGRTPGQGVLRGVEELKPAHCGYFTDKGLSDWAYWSLEDHGHFEPFEETVEHVRMLVLDSIERQLVSDVEVAAFLSGGLDSSAISSVAASHFGLRGKKLHTFSIDYSGNAEHFKPGKFQPSADGEYIDAMVEYIGSEHHTVVLDTEELAQALYAAVDARDLPGMADVDSSLLLFCKEIKKEATVALSGECADEIFGGYPWYRDKEIREREGFPWSQNASYRASFLPGPLKGKVDWQGYLKSRYDETCRSASVMEGQSPLERRMKEMLNLNFDWFMQTLLDRKDRMSMYSGLEVRVPYCDWRIAEYLYSVPWEMKEHGGYEKGLLREALKGLLPEKVLWRKKSPYPKTHNPSYLAAVSSMLREELADKGSPLYGVADAKALERLFGEDSSQPWYGQLMGTPQTIAYFVQLGYWMRKYKVRAQF